MHDLPEICKTGDVILFSTKDSGAKIIQRFTASEWNHVGVVVKPAQQQAYLLEWGGGIVVQPLAERLLDYHSIGSKVLTLRQLNLAGADRAAIEAKMESFAYMLLTDPTRVDNEIFPLGDVVGKLFKPGITQEHDVVDDLSSLFCSKTVAVCYKHVGLLARNVDANAVLPKHFGRSRDKTMDYRLGAKLGVEVDISFEPKAMRKVTSALLKLPKFAWGALSGQERAAAVLQQAARQWVARRRMRLARERAAAEQAALEEAVARGDAPKLEVSQQVLRARFADLSHEAAELVAPYEYAGADEADAEDGGGMARAILI